MPSSSKPSLIIFLINYVLYILICYIVFVLFGAPILSQHTETLLLSAVFAFLSGGPFLFNLRPSAKNLNSVLWFPSTKSEYFACCSFWGTLIGNWSSAFFLVLDWDRPWQAWPIPCVAGSFVGFILGIATYFLYPYTGPPYANFFQQALDLPDLVKVRFD